MDTAKTDPDKVVDPPALPDIMKCCNDKGITHTKCVNRLCDPKAVSEITVSDFIFKHLTFFTFDHIYIFPDDGSDDMCTLGI